MSNYYLPLPEGRFEIVDKEGLVHRLLSAIDTDTKRKFVIDLLLTRFDGERDESVRRTLLELDSLYWERFVDNLTSLDAQTFLKKFPDCCLDSCVCDPPAGIDFMNQEWDKDKGGREQWITWMQEIAGEILRVLKPGAHALVWALPRTSHWTATAWENAGFEIRDRISYLFGNGFPKNLDIGKKIKQWDGWGTALKPAVEDWWLFRKSLSKKTIVANVLEYGTGALNVDGCRVPVSNEKDAAKYAQNCSGDRGHEDNRRRDLDFKMGCGRAHEKGRFPSHLIHDGSAEAVAGFPESKSCNSPSSATPKSKYRPDQGNYQPKGVIYPGDSGSASRYFYTAKSSKKERNAGCEGLEGGNDHPTVKPLALMRYLCRLIVPPGGVVLDPFVGSGTTVIAAVQEGFRFVGCDMEPRYIEIARARLGYWSEN